MPAKSGKEALTAMCFSPTDSAGEPIFNNSGLSRKVAIHRVNVAKVSVSHSAEKVAVTLLKRFNANGTKRVQSEQTVSLLSKGKVG
jgi:hypothetical protein